MADPKLRTYNAALAIIHLVLGVGFAMYFAKLNAQYGNRPIQGLELSMRDHKLTIAPNNQNVVTGTWSSEAAETLDIGAVQKLLVAFFFITAAFHLNYYLTFDGQYSDMIANSNNYLRWVEYSISSSMMLLVIALLSGLKDRNTYVMIVATNIAMIYTGQVIEEKLQRGEDWRAPMAVGFMLMLAEWSVVIRDFNKRLDEVNTFAAANPSLSNGRVIPSWLRLMVWVLFTFFATFGFISLYGAYSGTSYENVEKLYLLFSLLAKATLGFFLAYGLGIRQERA
jgi:hypothetical protein